jgi:hypothetical protein
VHHSIAVALKRITVGVRSFRVTTTPREFHGVAQMCEWGSRFQEVLIVLGDIAQHSHRCAADRTPANAQGF